MNLYRIEHDAHLYFVEANSVADALWKWREYMIEKYGPPTGPLESDSIVKVHEETVIR